MYKLPRCSTSSFACSAPVFCSNFILFCSVAGLFCSKSNKKRFKHISQSNTGAVKPSYTYIVIRWCGSCGQVRFVCFGPERERSWWSISLRNDWDHWPAIRSGICSRPRGIRDIRAYCWVSHIKGEMLDSCARRNLDSTVKVTSLFGGGLRRTSSSIFHSYGVRGSHLIERDGVGNFHCLHTYLLLVPHTNQLKCV